jgi:hypothetical protein
MSASAPPCNQITHMDVACFYLFEYIDLRPGEIGVDSQLYILPRSESTLTMAHLTFYNIAISCFVAIGSGSYGYAFAVFPTSTGQPGFYNYFNLDGV